MSETSVLSGAYTALVTPFDEAGAIDYVGVAKLLAWHESQGMKGVVMAGTNGEGTSLSAPEKRDLVEFAGRHCGKLEVIAGLGCCSTAEAIWLCEMAFGSGAVAALALPPFYYKNVAEDGLRRWFQRVLDASPIPCILYNFPKTTGITLSPELVGELLAHERAWGVKDSSGDWELFESYNDAARSAGKYALLGDETLLLRGLQAGGAGTISGLANSFPALVSRLCQERTDALQQLVCEAASNLKKHPQPVVHKHVLAWRGLPGGDVRPPLSALTNGQMAEVDDFLAGFGF